MIFNNKLELLHYIIIYLYLKYMKYITTEDKITSYNFKSTELLTENELSINILSLSLSITSKISSLNDNAYKIQIYDYHTYIVSINNINESQINILKTINGISIPDNYNFNYEIFYFSDTYNNDIYINNINYKDNINDKSFIYKEYYEEYLPLAQYLNRSSLNINRVLNIINNILMSMLLLNNNNIFNLTFEISDILIYNENLKIINLDKKFFITSDVKYFSLQSCTHNGFNNDDYKLLNENFSQETIDIINHKLNEIPCTFTEFINQGLINNKFTQLETIKYLSYIDIYYVGKILLNIYYNTYFYLFNNNEIIYNNFKTIILNMIGCLIYIPLYNNIFECHQYFINNMLVELNVIKVLEHLNVTGFCSNLVEFKIENINVNFYDKIPESIKYEYLQKIGSGDHGDVSLVNINGKTYVNKIYNINYDRKFIDDKICDIINNINIMNYINNNNLGNNLLKYYFTFLSYEYLKDNKITFNVIMEYLNEYNTLNKYLQLNNLNDSDKIKLFLNILDIMHLLHSHNIIHNDFFYGNIMVKNIEDIKIIDYDYSLNLNNINIDDIGKIDDINGINKIIKKGLFLIPKYVPLYEQIFINLDIDIHNYINLLKFIDIGKFLLLLREYFGTLDYIEIKNVNLYIILNDLYDNNNWSNIIDNEIDFECIKRELLLCLS